MNVKKWHLSVGCLIILVSSASCYWFFKTRKTSGNIEQSRVGYLDLDKLMKVHPDWTKYQELQKEILKLDEKWKQNSGLPKSNNNDSENGIASNEAVGRQINGIEQMFKDEIAQKLDNLNQNLRDYSENLRNQMNSQLNEKVNLLNGQLKNEIQNKLSQMEKQLKDYRSLVNSEYQIRLANLQLQLATADLSSNKDDALSEKNKIQSEITGIRNEIDQKTTLEEQRLQKEAENYREIRNKEILLEIDQLKAELEKQYQTALAVYRQRLEADFNKWRTYRETNLKSAIELRKEQSETEFRRDNSQKLIFQSQASQIKEQIAWDIKQRAKLVARSKKFDIILNGGMNVSLPDLSPDIEKMLADQQ